VERCRKHGGKGEQNREASHAGILQAGNSE